MFDKNGTKVILILIDNKSTINNYEYELSAVPSTTPIEKVKHFTNMLDCFKPSKNMQILRNLERKVSRCIFVVTVSFLNADELM